MSDFKQSVVSALHVAIEQHRAGQPAASEALYRQLAAAPPKAPEALHLLGQVALQIGRQEAAADFLNRAVAADPKHPVYLNSYGVALRRIGRVEEALSAFRFAIALQPDFAAARNNLSGTPNAKDFGRQNPNDNFSDNVDPFRDVEGNSAKPHVGSMNGNGNGRNMTFQPPYDTGQGYVLYEYYNPDGSFDYEKYRRIQIAGNKCKIDWVWVEEENIVFLASYIKKRIGQPKFGICHGTRRGLEQAWFADRLGCEVIGTEISDTATDFPNTIQWDFHEIKDEWINSVDFIYSNSFDHSYDPELCLNNWMKCIKIGGLCILEHSSLHGPGGVSNLDPFGADLVQMPYLISIWGQGKFGVRKILPAPVKKSNLEYLYFIEIHKYE